MAKEIFLWDRDLCTDNWSAEIKEICEDFGFEHEYNNLQSLIYLHVRTLCSGILKERGMIPFCSNQSLEHTENLR